MNPLWKFLNPPWKYLNPTRVYLNPTRVNLNLLKYVSRYHPLIRLSFFCTASVFKTKFRGGGGGFQHVTLLKISQSPPPPRKYLNPSRKNVTLLKYVNRYHHLPPPLKEVKLCHMFLLFLYYRYEWKNCIGQFLDCWSSCDLSYHIYIATVSWLTVVSCVCVRACV